MGLSRSEIEILIKARNEAQGAFTALSSQVNAVTGASTGASQQLAQVETATRNASTASGAASVAFGLLAERLARGLVGAFGQTIEAANRLDSGLIGLASVATAFGNDAGKAQDAARELAADGLMSVGDAATGLKNLLAAGFGLPEAITLMNAFKDSAAFGRQGSLAFGEAIRGATEGIKNGNSILVDNAGVTKNLSNMLIDAGFSAQDLSRASQDVNVRMAIYNGILKETAPQLGDVGRYLDTTAGKQAAFSAQVEIAQQKIGHALQPALASALAALQPLIQVVGNNADTFVSLTAAVAAVVVPLAAAKAATALGLTPALAGLTTGIGSLVGAMRGGIGSFGDFRAGIQLAGEAAGLTTAKLGYLGTAAAVAAAAFIGWQIGKVIDDMTGLSGVVERFAGSAGRAALAAETAGAKQDVLNRATANAGRPITDYTEAIKLNAAANDVRIAKLDQTIEAQQRGVQGELLLGRITQEQANARLGALAAEQQAQEVQQSRLRLSDALATMEKKYRDEIAATGYTQGELLTILRDNEQGFMSWATQVKLSDETVKRLKDTLKDQAEAHKKTQEAQEKQAEATQKLREKLADMGVLSGTVGNQILHDLLAPLSLAADTKTPAFRQALINLLPQLEELRRKANLSGIQVDGLAEAIDRSRQAADDNVSAFRDWETTAPHQTIGELTEGMKTWNVQTELAEVRAGNLRAAFERMGITGRDESARLARQAEQDYRTIVEAVGRNAPEAVEAYKRMVEAQKDATRQIPSLWETEIFPRIASVVGTLQTAIHGSFAQIILGAKSLKEGMIDVWESIKSAVSNILASMLDTFINTFLRGILNALTGAQGGFAGAFAGLFSGGTGGGFNWQSLLGIGTTGTGAAGAAGAGAAGVGAAGAGAAGAGTAATAGAAGAAGAAGTSGAAAAGTAGAAGGAGGAGTTAAVLGTAAGGMAIAGGGFAMGQLFQRILGGAGWGAAAGGAAAGAGTGALVGTYVFPGIGTAVGAGIGALAGAIGGWVGESVGEKVNNIRDEFFSAFGAGGTGEGSGFGTVAAELHKLGPAGDEMFQHLIRADTMNDFRAALVAVQGALTGTEYATVKAREAADELWTAGQAMIAQGQTEEQVLQAQAASYSALYQNIVTTGATAPEALQPILERLIEMGLLVDQNGNAVTDLRNVYDRTGLEAEQRIADLTDQLQAAQAAEVQAAQGADYIRQQMEILGPNGGAALDHLRDRLADVTEEQDTAHQRVLDIQEELATLQREGGEDLTELQADIDVTTGRLDLMAQRGGIIGQEIADGLEPLPGIAAGVASGIESAFDGVQITIPVEYEYPEAEPNQRGRVPEAAGGVFADQPGLVVFGEGGEPELGGPVSFMAKALAGALGQINLGGGSGGTRILRLEMNRRVVGEVMYEEIPLIARRRGQL